MMALPVIRDGHERPDICGPCGGKCCRNMPGSELPEDWGAPDVAQMQERITSALQSGRWAIDWFEGDPRPDGVDHVEQAHYLRPATVGSEGSVFHASWGGDCCVFLGPSGCTIFDRRPAGCRGLVPMTGGNNRCRPAYAGKQDAAASWLPYDAMLVEIGRRIEMRR